MKKIYLSTPLLAVAITAVAADEQKPMNVIFIMSDDHTSQAIGAYNSYLTPLNPTPTIDKLAEDGVLFENCFCTNSISVPSRACIMTGQHSHTTGVLTLQEKLREDQQYMANEFHDMGYTTAMVGKWHLGCEPSSFDYYCVYPEQGKYFNPRYYSNSIKSKMWGENLINTKGYCTDITTNFSIEWLRSGRDKSKPFLLMHHFKAPHDMFEYAPRYRYYLEDEDIPTPATLFNNDKWGSEATRGKNDSLRHVIGSSISTRHEFRSYVNIFNVKEQDPERATYLAYQEYLKRYLRCVKAVDDNLERLFDYLKEADLWDNTIILYTGDQGMMLGEHDMEDKRWMYEESQRMPLIIRDPRSSQRGSRSDLMVNNIDFAPSLIEMAGGDAPKYMDGKSFSSIFEGSEPKKWRDAVYYRYYMHMLHHDIPAHVGVRTKDYKLILFYGRHFDPTRDNDLSMGWQGAQRSHTLQPTPVAFELYDMKNDPTESVNLADDPKYAEVMKMMKRRLKELRRDIGDTDANYPHIRKIIDEALK